MQREALRAETEVEDSDEIRDLTDDAELVIEATPEKFKLTGIQRVTIPKRLPDGTVELTQCTVLIGEDGKVKLIPLPPEFLLPDKEGPAKGFTIDFANAIGRKRGAAGIAAMSLVASACGTPQDDASPNNDAAWEKTIAQGSQALTAEAVASFGNPAEVSWTEAGDNYINISELDGRKVITFSRLSDIAMDGSEGVWVVDCEEFEDCLNGVPQEIVGLPPVGSFLSSAIYTTADGQSKILLKILGAPVFTADIERDEDGNYLASGEPAFFEPSINPDGVFSLVNKDNAPHIIYSSVGDARSQNLHTDPPEVEHFPVNGDDVSLCGGPHTDGEPGGVWVGSKFNMDDQNCELVMAPTLQGLANQITYLNNIANDLDTEDVMSPRIAENFLIFVAAGPNGTKIYYALVQPHCGDGNADPGETNQNCPADVPPVNTPDAGEPPAPDAAEPPAPDAAEEPDPDAAVEPPAEDATAVADSTPSDGGPTDSQPAADTLPGDANPADTLPADAAPTDSLPADARPVPVPADAAPTPDAVPNPACQTLELNETEESKDVLLDTNFIVQTNDCTLEICDLKVGDVEGHRITGEGEQFCSGKIRIEGEPGEIDFSFTHTENGKVKMDCKLLPGQAMNCQRIPKVRAAIEETLMHLNMSGLIGGKPVNTGSDGSSWDEMLIEEDPEVDDDFNTFLVTSFQPEGADPIIVFRPDDTGPLLIIPSTRENYRRTFELKFDENGNYIEEPFPTFPDTGTPNPEDASTEPTKTDAEVVDADIQPPTIDAPKKAAGCKCDFGQGETPSGRAAIIAFLGLLAAYFRRRERAKARVKKL